MKIPGFLLRLRVHHICVACAVVTGCGAAVTASAQPVRTVPDTIEQRMQACTPCHGKEGRASPAGYLPRIAGKPAKYLTNQLINFRDGRRYHAAMTHLVDQLSDDYLKEIGAYFGSLDLPYPPPRVSTERDSVLRRGEALVPRGDLLRRLPSCTQCHGYTLSGALPAIPGLVGLPADYLIGQLGAWKTGNRRAAAPDCMAEIARRLTGEDVRAVAVWLSSQHVSAGAKPAAVADLPLPLDCGSGVR